MAGHSNRMFLAIALPDRLKDAVEAAQRDLRTSLTSNAIRWTRREQFHLTLRFLGSVDVQRIDALHEAVRRNCDGFGEFQLSASGLGVFPGVRRPRVVWIGIDDSSGRLAILQRAVQEAASAFTSEPPEERFTGHVTLARCRDIGRAESTTLAGMVGRLATRSFGEWTVSDVESIRSETLPSGSRYTTLAKIRLRGGAGPRGEAS